MAGSSHAQAAAAASASTALKVVVVLLALTAECTQGGYSCLMYEENGCSGTSSYCFAIEVENTCTPVYLPVSTEYTVRGAIQNDVGGTIFFYGDSSCDNYLGEVQSSYNDHCFDTFDGVDVTTSWTCYNNYFAYTCNNTPTPGSGGSSTSPGSNGFPTLAPSRDCATITTEAECAIRPHPEDMPYDCLWCCTDENCVSSLSDCSDNNIDDGSTDT